MSYCAVYLNRIYREKNCPEKPEDPLVLEKDIPCDADFTFIDFVPSVLTYSSGNHQVEYHKFSHLIETANSWLHKNTQWKLVNCETVKLSYRHNLTSMVSRWEQQINPATGLWSPQIKGGEFETMLKVLRLWLRRKEMDEEEQGVMNESGYFAYTLKHIDFVPQKVTTNENDFESIDDLVQSVNQRLHKPDAARWKLIALESLKVEANGDWMIDCEQSLVEECTRHVTILRLFYEECNFQDEDLWPMKDEIVAIEIEDFKPRHISGGSFFKRPQFEPFSRLVQRAAKWLTNQSTLHFMNAQTIDVRVKSFSKIESRVSWQIENGDYIRILRVICWTEQHLAKRNLRPKSSTIDRQPCSNQLFLGTKTIMATKLFHPLDSLQQRIFNWLKSDARQEIVIISAETVDVYSKDNDEKNLERALEDCFQSNRLGSLNTFAFTAIRLYYCIVAESDVPDDEEPSVCSRTVSLSALNTSPDMPAARVTQVTFNLVRQNSIKKRDAHYERPLVNVRNAKAKVLSSQNSQTSSKLIPRRRSSEYNFERQFRRRAQNNVSSCNCM